MMFFSSVNRLCEISNPSIKVIVKDKIHTVLGKIKTLFAPLIDEEAASTMVGLVVPFERNKVTSVFLNLNKNI